jgi:hypothetical protein
MLETFRMFENWTYVSQKNTLQNVMLLWFVSSSVYPERVHPSLCRPAATAFLHAVPTCKKLEFGLALSDWK